MRIPFYLFFLCPLSLSAQEFSLGDMRKVPEPKPDLPIYKYSPDGHCSLLRNGSSGMMFWPGEDSCRTTGVSVFEMKNCVKVLPMRSKGGRPKNFALHAGDARGDLPQAAKSRMVSP